MNETCEIVCFANSIFLLIRLSHSVHDAIYMFLFIVDPERNDYTFRSTFDTNTQLSLSSVHPFSFCIECTQLIRPFYCVRGRAFTNFVDFRSHNTTPTLSFHSYVYLTRSLYTLCHECFHFSLSVHRHPNKQHKQRVRMPVETHTQHSNI